MVPKGGAKSALTVNLSNMDHQIYLDNNSTTHLLPEVRDAMAAAMADDMANPSSAHSAGERARRTIEDARQILADFLNADSECLTFTSSGTEANNAVLRSVLMRQPTSPRIVTTSVEHSSILKTCDRLAYEGANVIVLGVDSEGRVCLDELRATLQKPTALVSIQWANNETGAIQDIKQIATLCHQYRVPLHTDAAQAVGKLPIDLGTVPIDFLTFTGHKFHGPSGIGAIYSRNPRRLQPLIYGGEQERGLRAGTENLIGIAGFGRAAAIRIREYSHYVTEVSSLRDDFEAAVLARIPSTTINGNPEQRVCNTTNIRFEGVNGEALVAQLDAHSIYCSQSSACTSSRPEPSYVLRSMGLTESQAHDSIRFSFSQQNTRDEIGNAVEILAVCCERLRTSFEHGFDDLEVSHA